MPRLVYTGLLIALLQCRTASNFHALWGNDISLLYANWFNHGWVHKHKQLTNMYLLGLAVRNKGRRVTFDRRIALSAENGASG